MYTRIHIFSYVYMYIRNKILGRWYSFFLTRDHFHVSEKSWGQHDLAQLKRRNIWPIKVKKCTHVASIHVPTPQIITNYLLQNDDEYEAIAGSEFYVSRTATKSGSSSYTISGKTATVKEVATLLKASGIDLDHNRFLILQVSF